MQKDVSSAAQTSIELDVVSELKESVAPISSVGAGSRFLDTTVTVSDYTGHTPRQVSDQMSNLLEQSQQAQKKVIVINELAKISNLTGGYVQFMPDMSFVPALIGNDGQPVFLYDFVEVLDGILDYDDITKELPTLSVSQISGAIEFLRKTAQFNSRGVDIDELEDMSLVHNQQFLDELRTALADRENMRVLNVEESNG